MSFKVPRGTRDILPDEINVWSFLEDKLHKVSQGYGYKEIRTPIFEHTEVFSRSVGEDTDIVSREMYNFKDRGGRDITLRPEGTAAVVRAYLDNRLDALPKPVKLYYYGPMFRYDRPQSGRYRQFFQFGLEYFGAEHPAADVEVIALVMDFLKEINLKNVELHINSVGCSACRQVYRAKLLDYLEPCRENLCVDCRKRFDKNPLRILDCKNNHCQDLFNEAPDINTTLCGDCFNHFQMVQELLSNLNIVFKINTRLVRGLDYYSRTAFEFVSTALGAQSSIGGGGRYDNLVEVFGGEHTPAVGLAMGMERLILSLSEQSDLVKQKFPVRIFLALDSDSRLVQALKIANNIREAGISAEVDYMGRSLKAQMKYAGKNNFSHVIILGEREQQRGKITLKEMNTGEQDELSVSETIDKLKIHLNGEDK